MVKLIYVIYLLQNTIKRNILKQYANQLNYERKNCLTRKRATETPVQLVIRQEGKTIGVTKIKTLQPTWVGKLPIQAN